MDLNYITTATNVENYYNEFIRLFQIKLILFYNDACNDCERVKIVSRCSQAPSLVQKGLISERREIGEFNINRQSRGI